jgi:mannose-6-phosphate isomerase
MSDLYPLTFEPVLKAHLWGGRSLAALGRTLPAQGVVAESWEIAAHENGTTAVRDGAYAGVALDALQDALGASLSGANTQWALERGKFPLLVKLIDAAQPLSIQVHPGDDYALAHERNELGKTEMWVVLRAKPGAELILGVRRGVTRDAFRSALATGTPESLLHRVPVTAGDHICVPAGTVHAIMDGLVIAEIQQNSDTTYRVFDWNRVGPDGRPRELQIDKALDVIDFSIVEPAVCPPVVVEKEPGFERALLCRSPYFVTERVTLDAGVSFEGRCDGDSLEIWGVIDGEAEVNTRPLRAVEFCLLPAALGPFLVETGSGATLLRTYVDSV